MESRRKQLGARAKLFPVGRSGVKSNLIKFLEDSDIYGYFIGSEKSEKAA